MNLAHVHRTAFVLCASELRVVPYLVAGFTNGEIGHMLGIRETTVESHRDNIFGKVGVSTRAQLASYALINGLVTEKQITEIWAQHAPHLLGER